MSPDELKALQRKYPPEHFWAMLNALLARADEKNRKKKR